MLGYCVGNNLTIASHSIHLNLLGMLNKLAYYHGVVLTYIGCQFEELLKLLLVGTYVHCST